MEEKKQAVTLETVAAKKQEQTLVEGEVALPGGIREEATVISCEARSVISGVETQNQRLALDGTVVFLVLYRQGDDAVRVLEASSAFSHALEMPGVEARMRPWVQADIVSAEAQPVSGRMRLRASVDLQAGVLAQENIPVVTDIQGVEEMQSRLHEWKAVRHTAAGRTSVLLREEFEITSPPAISETLYARAEPVITSVSGGEGKVLVEGDVALEVFHAGAESEWPVVVTRHHFPFEQTVPLQGEEGGENLRATLQVQDVVASSVDAGDGMRVLRVETVLDIEAFAMAEETISYLQDAYTLRGDEVELLQKEYECFAGWEEIQGVENDKLILTLLPDAQPLEKAVFGVLEPNVLSSDTVGTRTVIEGILDAQVAYIPQGGGPLTGVRKNLPFRIAFQGSIPAGGRIQLKATDVQAEGLAADRVELKYQMRMQSQSVASQPVDLTLEAKSHPASGVRRGLTVIWPQKGETLWDVGKKLRVTTESLERLNPGAGSDPGRGLIAVRRG